MLCPTARDDLTLQFDSARDNHLREAPPELMAAPKNPEDMRFGDLRRFIGALERSGGNADELKVELAQKIAVPVTCIIIALFGAPLATSTQRGGAAYGIAISSGDHGAVPDDDPAHQGDRGQRTHSAVSRRLGPERDLHDRRARIC